MGSIATMRCSFRCCAVQRRLDERVSDGPVGRWALCAGATNDRAAGVRSLVFRGAYGGGDRASPRVRSGLRKDDPVLVAYPRASIVLGHFDRRRRGNSA